ncbi:hypothetical protein, partial [Citrobacter freundii]|uniref:hypothetical protein n=1 Tax=Citrobacter freundii TaxID=546 RepID=UPI001953D05C
MLAAAAVSSTVQAHNGIDHGYVTNGSIESRTGLAKSETSDLGSLTNPAKQASDELVIVCLVGCCHPPASS